MRLAIIKANLQEGLMQNDFYDTRSDKDLNDNDRVVMEKLNERMI